MVDKLMREEGGVISQEIIYELINYIRYVINKTMVIAYNRLQLLVLIKL